MKKLLCAAILELDRRPYGALRAFAAQDLASKQQCGSTQKVPREHQNITHGHSLHRHVFTQSYLQGKRNCDTASTVISVKGDTFLSFVWHAHKCWRWLTGHAQLRKRTSELWLVLWIAFWHMPHPCPDEHFCKMTHYNNKPTHTRTKKVLERDLKQKENILQVLHWQASCKKERNNIRALFRQKSFRMNK